MTTLGAEPTTVVQTTTACNFGFEAEPLKPEPRTEYRNKFLI